MALKNLTLTGLSAMQKRLDKLGGDILDVSGKALFLAGEEIIAESKEKFVPVDTGALMNSLTTHPPEKQGRSVEVTLSAGGPAAPYAVAVHELQKNYRHGRQWKYLETPFKNSTGRVKKRIAKTIQDHLKTLTK